jgi:hypothetical protein
MSDHTLSLQSKEAVMKERTKRWFACWGGPILVVTLILIGTFTAALVLRELRPGGLLDVVLRGGA